MLDITVLKEDQVWGDNRLNIFKTIDPRAAVTDVAILRGAWVSDSYHIDSDSSLAGRTGYYWLQNSDGDGDACVVLDYGTTSDEFCDRRKSCVRAALPYSSIQSIAPNFVRGADGLFRVEYGLYPQMAVDDTMQNILENAYNANTLTFIGKCCTFDARKYNEYDKSFLAEDVEGYEYNGEKYARIKANSYYDGNNFTLSNNKNYKDGDYVWTKVEPITWVKHPDDDWVISEKAIVSGIRFYKERGKYDDDFSKTDLKWYLDNHLSKDIERLSVVINSAPLENTERRTRIQKFNPDTTDVSKRVKMSYTEMIQNWIESGQSVLLRGPSGIGKTDRLKTLYPDLIYIKLTNNMFPEKVVGSINLQTGQNIPPDFAKQALLSCANEEEKKLINENIQNLYDLAEEIYERSKNEKQKVVIMLDELLNVKPAVQSLVYTLVLNRLVETGKGLKLPANTVVVATGNQKKYSSVAEDLAEPLEKRFDHILDMEPKVGEWLYEYAIPNKVHPSVIGYILSKYISKNKSELISDIGYFYEEPEVGEMKLDKNGCNGRTNDPRGWVSISNTLYSFEEDLINGKFIGKDVENLLQVSIGTKLRNEWAMDFFNFYNIPTLSPKNVVENDYTEEDLPKNINERFACVTSLLLADENEVVACREFIRKHCDPEYLSVYDICWVGNDEKRMELISELTQISTYKDEDETVIKGVVTQ